MKIPEVQKLGAVDIEGGGRFLVLMVREGVAERLVAASPGARHDVPDLEVERLARALTTHVSAHKTRSRSHATVACCKAIAAEYRRLSTPPGLVPRDDPTREDIEG